MRVIRAAIIVLLLYGGSASQLTNCRFVHGCNTSEIGGACYALVDYTRCSDGEIVQKRHWCYPTSCKRNCTCECMFGPGTYADYQGYTLSWCVCPDTLVTQTYQCVHC